MSSTVAEIRPGANSTLAFDLDGFGPTSLFSREK